MSAGWESQILKAQLSCDGQQIGKLQASSSSLIGHEDKRREESFIPSHSAEGASG